MKRHSTAHPPAGITESFWRDDLLFIVPGDFTHDLFRHVFYGDQPGRAAEFVDDDGDGRPIRSKAIEKLLDGSHFRNEASRPAGCRKMLRIDAIRWLEEKPSARKNSNDLVHITIVDRQATKSAFLDRSANLSGVIPEPDRDH